MPPPSLPPGAAPTVEPGSDATSPLSADDSREVARLAGALSITLFVFVLLSVVTFLGTGDPATAAAAVIQAVSLIALIWVQRQILHGAKERGVTVLVVAVLVAVLAMAPLPPPVPALAAAPIMAVAIALSFLRGRRLTAALIGAWAVSVVIAVIVEFTPASPDLPSEVAAAFRISTFAAVVGLVAFVLYRHRGRLEHAVVSAERATDALRDSELRYGTIVEGLNEVVFRVDARGRWVLLSQAWEQITHHRVVDTLGRPSSQHIHPDDRDRHLALARAVVENEVDTYRLELRIVGSEGTVTWVEVQGRPERDPAGVFVSMSGTLTDITIRRELEERLLEQAFHDELTGLANRALFKDRVAHALARRPADRRHVGLLFLDLDRFKTVNDSLGHAVGDRLLVAIADRLQATVRPQDTIARLGGDEFAILVDDIRTPRDIIVMADRILSAFDASFRIDERDVVMRSSIGLVLASSGHRTADDLLRDADVAMYRAKVGGRGSYALFEPSMQAEVAARQELESELREAIDSDRLTLAYQPIVDLTTRRIIGVEALARWRHPRRGDVPPSVFIPNAEETGLILPLGRWVVRQACLDLAALRRSSSAAANLRLSVNLSPRQLSGRAIVDDVLHALRDAGLTPDALDVEITEGLVLDAGDDGLTYLRMLRDAGCRVTFDDFGTGYSSLGNLRSLPIDGLKIDRSFVASMLGGGVDAAVVDAIIRLGAALDVAVVAEGVEDLATADRLAEIGCPFAQGYYFGRPQPIEAIAAGLAAPGEEPTWPDSPGPPSTVVHHN